VGIAPRLGLSMICFFLTTLAIYDLGGHSLPVLSVAFSPNVRTLAIAAKTCQENLQ
jgi:hypothetical protein